MHFVATKHAYNRVKCAVVIQAHVMWSMCCREDLEWSGAASRAPPCTVGYLVSAVPSLETARCQAAESHGQQLADVLTGKDRQADGQKAPIKKEQMGTAGASNAACTVLVSRFA